MNIIKLYQDYHIPVAAPGQRHFRNGWANTPCCFCTGAHPGNHLGYCYQSESKHYGQFICHRCGSHKTVEVIATLLRITETEARQIIRSYGGVVQSSTKPIQRQIVRPYRDIPLPPGTQGITMFPGAIAYVKKRGFDPEELSSRWKVLATGPGSEVRIKKVDGEGMLDYSYRLIAPIYYGGKLVTYQGRDWTGKQKLKYMAAPPSVESVPIKDILYGLDLAEGLERVVLVEGVTDAWKVGTGAVACFGIKYREKQVHLLAERFRRIAVAFDTEPQAKLQAKKIIKELRERGVQVEIVRLPKGRDPGDMEREELKRLIGEGR